MAQIQFYHLTATPLERALPKLLEKIIAGGFRAAVVAESEARVEQLNQLLWTYDPGSFLPHGSAKDGHDEDQPIYLSTSVQTPNRANILVITNGVNIEGSEAVERVVDIFDGNNPDALNAARKRWQDYKNAGYALSYLQQSESGGWQQKAVA